MRLILPFLLLFSLLGCGDTYAKTAEASEKEEATSKEPSVSKDVQRDYDEAMKLAREQNKSVFILMETEHCRWCKRLKGTTLQDEALAKRLSSEFVVLVLNRDTGFYPDKFNPKGVPTVYMTDSQGEIYATVVGYRKNPQEYLKWFDYIAIERGL